MNKIAFWCDNARSIALPQSMLPALTAVAMASNQVGFSWWMAVVAVAGVVFAHLGMNLADDYFDYHVKGAETREQLASEGMRSRVAKYPYLTNGSATVRGLALAMTTFLILAAACGLFLVCFRGSVVSAVAFLGFILGISYSGGPLKMGYHGLGELVIGVMFGPLLMFGTYYACCGVYAAEILWVSVPVGLLVTNIVYSHSIMDALPDAKVGKMTFARLLRSDGAMLAASAMFNFLPFVLIGLAIVLGELSVWYAVVGVVLPMAVYLFASLRRFVGKRDEAFATRWWMGPMGDWEGYKRIGIEWFMIRWLVARNLISFFCLLIILFNLILRFV